MTDDSRRNRLLDRVRRLPPDHLASLEEFLARLESAAAKPVPGPTYHDWPHAPLHRLSEHGTYIVTAATLHRQHHFSCAPRLDLLQHKLLELAQQYGWQLEAWAIFSNHYHFVGHAQSGSEKLNFFLGHLHSVTALEINRLDNTAGRQVWHNFWETQLTFKRSYLARLNYVHQNPVKHGVVRMPNQYRWCSAAWLERTATTAQVKTIYSFKTDKVHVLDDFEVLIPAD